VLKDTGEDHDMVNFDERSPLPEDYVHDHFCYLFQIVSEEVLSEDGPLIILILKFIFKYPEQPFRCDLLTLSVSAGFISLDIFVKLFL
jgi:hypothetical protein